MDYCFDHQNEGFWDEMMVDEAEMTCLIMWWHGRWDRFNIFLQHNIHIVTGQLSYHKTYEMVERMVGGWVQDSTSVSQVKWDGRLC